MMEHRKINVGASDYATRKIQPWDIWKEYKLDPWRADIVKRILRNKEGADEVEELKKIKHICDELISHVTDERSERNTCTIKRKPDDSFNWTDVDMMTDEWSENWTDEEITIFKAMDEPGAIIPVPKDMDLIDLAHRKAKYDASKTPKESIEEASEEAEEAQDGNPIGGTEIGEDYKLSLIEQALREMFGGDSKVRVVRHTVCDNGTRVEERNCDKLSPSEEPTADRLRACSSGRVPQMGGWVSEDVAALERFKEDYNRLTGRLQFGNTNPRDIRQPLSDAFAQLMESLGQVSEGQTRLAI